MTQSSIEWTQMTWNPTTGCSKVSQGCKHCYAEAMSRRLQAMGIEKYREGFSVVREHPSLLGAPYRWRSSRIVFVNSMSDLFHENISENFIQRVFQVMNDNSQHIFQVLTKRSERLLAMNKILRWTENVWMGVSIESRAVLQRVTDLKRTDARIKFLSCEPLLEAIPELELSDIDWVIVGGESGPSSREMEREWVWDIKRQCKAAKTAFFFKQWGGRNKKKSGRILAGKTYDEMPVSTAR